MFEHLDLEGIKALLKRWNGDDSEDLSKKLARECFAFFCGHLPSPEGLEALKELQEGKTGVQTCYPFPPVPVPIITITDIRPYRDELAQIHPALAHAQLLLVMEHGQERNSSLNKATIHVQVGNQVHDLRTAPTDIPVVATSGTADRQTGIDLFDIEPYRGHDVIYGGNRSSFPQERIFLEKPSRPTGGPPLRYGEDRHSPPRNLGKKGRVGKPHWRKRK